MPLAISTLYTKVGKDGLKILGFEDYYKGAKPKEELPPKQERIVQKSLEKIEEAEITFTENPIQSISETNLGVDTVLNTLNDTPLILKN